MKIVIVGAGALGSIVAALLGRTGVSVSVVARGSRADLIEARGLTLTGLADVAQRVGVIRPGPAPVDADVVMLCTKTFDTRQALAGVRFRQPPAALSLQNGVRKNELLAETFGGRQVLGAAATVSGELLEDGRVRFTLNNSLLVGELDGAMSGRLTQLVALLQTAGLAAEAVDNIRSVEWTKYAGFLPLMAVSLLTRLPTGRALSDARSARIAGQLIREVAGLAAASGVRLEGGGALPVASIAASAPGDATETVLKFGRHMQQIAPEHRVSALQDLMRGSRLEVDDILGHGVELGQRLGVPVPTMEVCYGLCAALADA